MIEILTRCFTYRTCRLESVDGTVAQERTEVCNLPTPLASTRRRRKGSSKQRRRRLDRSSRRSVRSKINSGCSAVWTRRSSLRLSIGLPDYWIAINVRWLRQQGGCKSFVGLVVDCQHQSVSMRPATDSAATVALLVTCLTMTSFLHTGEQCRFFIRNGCMTSLKSPLNLILLLTFN